MAGATKRNQERGPFKLSGPPLGHLGPQPISAPEVRSARVRRKIRESLQDAPSLRRGMRSPAGWDKSWVRARCVTRPGPRSRGPDDALKEQRRSMAAHLKNRRIIHTTGRDGGAINVCTSLFNIIWDGRGCAWQAKVTRCNFNSIVTDVILRIASRLIKGRGRT